MLLARSPHIDVLVDVTGSVEFGAHVVLEAFRHGKDVVLMNAELDATIGPILQVYAEQHGVILSACEGDEPGVQMNLYRWVKGLGLTPRVMGNVKGLQDPYRNPTTQQAFAERWGQNAAMVTSFADGSKISFEQTIVANATGFKVRARGMSRGLQYTRRYPRRSASSTTSRSCARSAASIDYVVGTPLTRSSAWRSTLIRSSGTTSTCTRWARARCIHSSSPIISCISRCRTRSPRRAVPRSGRAKPLGGPVVEVCAVAKRDLKAGEILDDYGMYMTYGEAVNVDEMSGGRYLPEGLVEGAG